jgi:chromosome segregation ATPase
MFSKFRETIDSLVQDFKEKLPTSLKASQDKIEHVIEENRKRCDAVKDRSAHKINVLTKEIKDLEANFDIEPNRKNELIKQKQDEIHRINDESRQELDRLKKERDDELAKIAKDDQNEIERLQKEKEEEIQRLKRENDEHIGKMQKDFEDQVEKTRRENQDSIDKMAKEKDEQIDKLSKEFEKLRDKYKAPV